MQRPSSNNPYHIAIIPDGNRRWAKARGLPILKGHEAGINKFEDLLKWCKEYDIRMLSLWIFSTENANRSKEEVEGLMRMLNQKAGEMLFKIQSREDLPKVRVRFYGRRDNLPKNVVEKMKMVEERTRDNDQYFLNIMLNYGGRPELLAWVRSVAEAYKRGETGLDEKDVLRYLWTGDLPEPDVIIRTSGEMRLSGFMPWHSGYSELFFVKKLWPDFSKEDFAAVIEEYKRRERRFGR